MDQNSLALHYRMMPNRKTVSYAVRSGTTWAAAVDVTDAEQRNPSRRDLAESQLYSPNQVLVWHLWRIPLDGIVPKQGDRLTYNSELWLVQSVAVEMLGNRYRLTCTKGH